MNSETYGMFGPQGLLAKIEAEEGQDNPVLQSLDQSSENSVDQRSLDKKPVDRSCSGGMQSKSSASKYTHDQPFVVPLSNLSPIEAAFSIEEISKRIFSLLEPSDLLQCRLVSSSWLRMATNDELLKLNKHAIFIWHIPQSFNEYATVVTVKTQIKNLDVVTDFLDGRSSRFCLYSAKVRLEMTTALDSFMFLDRYGFIVNSLKIEFQTKDFSPQHNILVYQMESVLEFLTRLVTEQLPNLEELQVSFSENTKIEGEIDPVLLASINDGSYFAGKQSQSLREISFEGSIPYEIINAVCCLAPKMDKLWTYDLLGFVAKHKHWAYLINDFDFSPSAKNWSEVDAFEAIVSSEAKLNPKSFVVAFNDICDKPDPCPRSATLLSKAFEKSCHSLEELSLRRVFFLTAPGLPCFPKVKKILFEPSFKATPEWMWLPQGTSIATTFPNLNTIGFYYFFDVSTLTNFLSRCKDEKVESVKRINCEGFVVDQKILQARFPNAKIFMRK